MSDIDNIASDFEFFDDWEQRYQYLVELGEQLGDMPETEKTDDNRVIPCMSKVWVKAFWDKQKPDSICFHGDCDTSIIKGVVALLVRLFSGKTVKQILELDVDRLFDRIHLAEHLSPSRHVGIYAIVDVMKSQVRTLHDSKR